MSDAVVVQMSVNERIQFRFLTKCHNAKTYNDFSRLLDGNVLGKTVLIPFLFKYKTVSCGSASSASCGINSM